jgi:hypothetical protein
MLLLFWPLGLLIFFGAGYRLSGFDDTYESALPHELDRKLIVWRCFRHARLKGAKL